MRLDQLDRRQHFAVAGRLQESDILGVGVEHVHHVEIDAPGGERLPQMPGHDQVCHDGDRPAVADEEQAAQVRVEIRFHDEVGRLAIGQPYPAHRRHGRADHHRLKNRFLRRGRQHQG
jgi:hypothetical protein